MQSKAQQSQRPAPMQISYADYDGHHMANNRLIYFFLLLSLLLHFVVGHFWVDSKDAPPADTIQAENLRFTISLSPAHKPTAKATISQPLNEVVVRPKRKSKETTKTPSDSGSDASVKKPLDVSRELILSTLKTIENSPHTSKSLSENGAVVFNAALLAQLNASHRRTGISTGNNQAGLDTSFSGSSWTDFMRIDNRCFKVVRGDPLTPGSHDMWYRMKCQN